MTEDFDKNTYETPPDFYGRCHQEFRFQIDAAAQPQTAKCKQFVSRDQNALGMIFRNKRIWLNPPYGDSDYPLGVWTDWCARMCHQYGNTIAYLIPSSTDTTWWHELVIPQAAEVRNIRGRIHFLANGVPQTQTRHLNSLVIWRPGMRGAQLSSMAARLKEAV